MSKPKIPLKVVASARQNPIRRRGGFTLVEGMVAAVVLIISAAGVLGVMQRAYELAAMARHREQARAVLTTFQDRFLRESTVGLFAVTGNTPTGVGLTWDEQQPIGATPAVIQRVGTAAGLDIVLGRNDPDTGMMRAVVRRRVNEVDETNGQADDTNSVNTSAGKMLMAMFTIEYTFKGQTVTESLTVARAANQ